MSKFMHQEEELELILAGVVEMIESDDSVSDDVSGRIAYKVANDIEYRNAVMRTMKAVLGYCVIAAEDRTGASLLSRQDVQLPRTIDEDVAMVARRLITANTGPGSEMEWFAGTNQGVGVEIFRERIKVLLAQLN